MLPNQTDVIKHRLEKELGAIEHAAGFAAGSERLALETLARVFRHRLTDLPWERPTPPPRVQDVMPPVHQHVGY
jgi:hypothetical protein